MRVLNIAIVVAALLPLSGVMSASEARQGITFPKELQGTWDIGPQTCLFPVNPDSIAVTTSPSAGGYEHLETTESARSHQPPRWTLTAISDAAR